MTFLAVGDVNADITITTRGPVARGGDTPGTVSVVAGGSAANVAAGVGRLGVASRFVGVIGDDLLGGILVDSLRRNGVDVRPVRRADVSSRAIAALIDTEGDRSMVSDLTTQTVMRLDDIDPTWFDGVSWLHLTAYTWFADGGPDVWAAIRGLARQRGVPWSVDPSSAEMLGRVRPVDEAHAAFNGARVIFPNEIEAERLTGLSDIDAAARSLLDLASEVVVTCGERGVVSVGRAHPLRHHRAHDAEVVNTLGAGDAFAAGYIADTLAEQDVERCVERGLAAAADVVASSRAH
ncbi:MAG: carbohydrate kinase family protein [Ilumatobacter sp.]